MRPIFLLSTIYKLLAKCLVRHLSTWLVRHAIITPEQKGFMPYDGVFEHNFVLERIIRKTKETSSNVFLVWLDIQSAFSMLPHQALFDTLSAYGVGSSFVDLIKDIYTDNITSFLGCMDTSSPVSVFFSVSARVVRYADYSLPSPSIQLCNNYLLRPMKLIIHCSPSQTILF